MRSNAPAMSRSRSEPQYRPAPGRYFDLDLVGMAIATGLAPTLGRQTATAIVLGFFNQWVAAVGHAEADAAQNYFFAMGAVGSGRR